MGLQHDCNPHTNSPSSASLSLISFFFDNDAIATYEYVAALFRVENLRHDDPAGLSFRPRCQLLYYGATGHVRL